MDFFELSGAELVSIASILAITISKNFNSDENNTLGNFFSALGQNLCTIADAQTLDENYPKSV